VLVGNSSINNFIGGIAVGTGNVISGNGGNGILIEFLGQPGSVAPFETKIRGNLIGTNATGTVAIPNGAAGIAIRGGISSRIGGTGTEMPAARNVISGNTGDGIRISENGIANRVTGNYIGVGTNGTTPLANTGNGVTLASGAASNIIGGPEANAGNTIANNANGVVLAPDAGAGNLVDPNSIYGNVGLGIDIGDDGHTPNDPGDADTGPNNLQNYPQVVNFGVDGSGHLIVSYKVDSDTANSNYGTDGLYVEFFRADSSGEGEVFLGSDMYTAADHGAGAPQTKMIDLGAPAGALITPGSRVTATATDADGNTSEFFPPFLPTAAPVRVSGSVMTSHGVGIRAAVVTLTDVNGATRRVVTDAFGRFAFTDVESGRAYVVSARSGRFVFWPQMINVVDEVSGLSLYAR
jgi:hypothetical protein